MKNTWLLTLCGISFGFLAHADTPQKATGSAAAEKAAPAVKKNEAAAPAAQVGDGSTRVPVDLFPKDVLERSLTDPALADGPKKQEKSVPRMALGDDTSWKTHVVQATVMGGLFATLVALCGGGKCLLPAPSQPTLEARPSPGPEAEAQRGR